MKFKKNIFLLSIVLLFCVGTKNVLAQTISRSPSILYVPLIGITLVPDPLALPNGAGYITYHYAVKNFLPEVALHTVHVVDDICSPVKFVTGDDNGDGNLDYSETWRYACTTKLSKTTTNTAIATATANNLTATHKAYATVVVGSNTPPPLVSIVNVTKVAYPLSLPSVGGKITYTYKVNNPGVIPLSNVTVTDDKCTNMSGKLGDTNGNNLLDINEVWVYTCTTTLTQTTTNTVHVTGFANGLQAVDTATITVNVALAASVASPITQGTPKFPTAGEKPKGEINAYVKPIIWAILSCLLGILVTFSVLTRKSRVGGVKLQ